MKKSFWNEAGLWLIGIPIFLWTMIPIYHMVLFAISAKDQALNGRLWPDNPTFRNFEMAMTCKGADAEHSGIIRAGAKLVNVIANSVVPKITTILGGSFGAGNYALCGKAFDPRFIFAWPTAKYAVMGGQQAANKEESTRQAQSDGRTDCTAGQGAFAFDRMHRIASTVAPVVQDVDRAGHAAKSGKNEQNALN